MGRLGTRRFAAIAGTAVVALLLGTGWQSAVSDSEQPDLALLTQGLVSAPPVSMDSQAGLQLEPSSFRNLGRGAELRYWVARDLAGNVCLITAADEEEGAMSCAAPGVFNRQGIALRYESHSVFEEAYLLPDSVAAGENLIAVQPGALAADQARQGLRPATVQRAHDFELRTLPSRDRSVGKAP